MGPLWRRGKIWFLLIGRRLRYLSPSTGAGTKLGGPRSDEVERELDPRRARNRGSRCRHSLQRREAASATPSSRGCDDPRAHGESGIVDRDRLAVAATTA